MGIDDANLLSKDELISAILKTVVGHIMVQLLKKE
ncbi:hypothetical protein [Candidatus Orientia mediorientalis]